MKIQNIRYQCNCSINYDKQGKVSGVLVCSMHQPQIFKATNEELAKRIVQVQQKEK